MDGEQGPDVARPYTRTLASPQGVDIYPPAPLPEFAFNITSRNIKAKSRKLKTSVSIGPTQDLRGMWGEERFATDVVERLAALTWSVHRDVVHILGDLPDDLIPDDVKDMAMGNILRLIPEKYWGSTWARENGVMAWEKSALGKISDVITKRGLRVGS